jgi:hypothetical protein
MPNFNGEQMRQLMKEANNIRAITVLADENENRLAVTDYLVRTAGISAGTVVLLEAPIRRSNSEASQFTAPEPRLKGLTDQQSDLQTSPVRARVQRRGEQSIFFCIKKHFFGIKKNQIKKNLQGR